MTTLRTITASALTLSALAAAAVAPATAAAPDVKLGGAPTMRLVDSDQARLQFATTKRLARTKTGAVNVRITFAGGQKVSSVKPVGRHGSDVVYRADVKSERDLRVGTKYTVTFKFAGQAAVKRLVKLQDKPS